jgi:hypothetical protein
MPIDYGSILKNKKSLQTRISEDSQKITEAPDRAYQLF